MLLNQPIRQIAYYVEDVNEAARRHSALYGSGPFFVLDIPEMDVTYRGKKQPFEHTTAVGQWGNIQVEFLQQDGDEPSILRELYPAGCGRTGLHHVALFVDDINDAVAQMEKAGFPEVCRSGPKGTDTFAVFVDTVQQFGHFVELYEPKPALAALYEMVAKAATGFAGSDPVRSLKF